ncbi:MAG TPA: phytanoyl-CoA dioxygenase family protein [Bauldia sp.]|nr:phytanoyl-CoA dioxygenase family protein [Bauldia sp.]
MPFPNATPRALSDADIARFITDGYIRIDDAFAAALAAEARAILWRDTGADPDNPATWTRPVVRLGAYSDPPFVEAANTPLLHAAYDALTGAGRWLPPRALGTFPVRFPSPADPGDTGWHVDASFGTEAPNFLDWRVNVVSRGRLLLMLFLFSDVGEVDAPTRIRVGSHMDIARQLAPAGDAGMTLGQLAADNFAGSAHRREVLATGPAGTVYLCHPFLVHAAQPHRGTQPRFMAQPPLLSRAPATGVCGGDDTSPVAAAIRAALA